MYSICSFSVISSGGWSWIWNHPHYNDENRKNDLYRLHAFTWRHRTFWCSRRLFSVQNLRVNTLDSYKKNVSVMMLSTYTAVQILMVVQVSPFHQFVQHQHRRCCTFYRANRRSFDYLSYSFFPSFISIVCSFRSCCFAYIFWCKIYSFAVMCIQTCRWASALNTFSPLLSHFHLNYLSRAFGHLLFPHIFSALFCAFVKWEPAIHQY